MNERVSSFWSRHKKWLILIGFIISVILSVATLFLSLVIFYFIVIHFRRKKDEKQENLERSNDTYKEIMRKELLEKNDPKSTSKLEQLKVKEGINPDIIKQSVEEYNQEIQKEKESLEEYKFKSGDCYVDFMKLISKMSSENINVDEFENEINLHMADCPKYLKKITTLYDKYNRTAIVSKLNKYSESIMLILDVISNSSVKKLVPEEILLLLNKKIVGFNVGCAKFIRSISLNNVRYTLSFIKKQYKILDSQYVEIVNSYESIKVLLKK